jgi:hypothetical protein
MRAYLWLGLASVTLAGCVAAPAPPPAAAPPPPALSPLGLEAVMGATAQRLIAQFGNPDLDLREGPARKLQFLGPACVLDAYLYPPGEGRGEPVVTHVDARQPDGREMDRASCVAALIAERQTR